MAKSRARKLADLIVGAGIDIDGNLTFDGGSTSADLTFADNDKANFGDASDLQIYHDGSNSYITDSGAGNLRISGTLLQLNDASFNKYFLGSGSIVRLYYADSEKLQTTSSGVSITGQLTASTNLIATTATYSPIVYGGSSSLQLKSNTSEMFAQFVNNGAAELYYDNSKKLETTSTGVLVSGDVRAINWFKGASDTNTLYSDTSNGTLIQTPSNTNDAAGTFKIRDSLGVVHFSLNTNTNASSFHGGTISSGAITTTGDTTIKNSGVAKLKFAPLGSTYGAGFDVMTVTGTSSSPYTSTIGFSNYGVTDAMVIKGNNVGIGTTSPTSKLTVNTGASGNTATFSSGTSTSGDYSGITLHAYSISGVEWYGSEIRSTLTASNPNYNNPRLGFFTQDHDTYLPADRTEKMSILSNGKVGIGTTSPSEKLTVAGPIGVSATGYTANATTANFGLYTSGLVDTTYIQMPASGQFQVWKPSTGAVVTVLESGNVGIGTANPQTALHIYDTPAEIVRMEGNDEFAYASFYGTVSSTAQRLGYMGFANDTSTAADFNFANNKGGIFSFNAGIDVDGDSSIGGGANGTHRIGRLTVAYSSSSNPVLSSDGAQINFSDEIALRGVGIRKVSSVPSNLDIIQDRTGYDIVFKTSPTTNAVNEEVIRFTHDLKVGIGTTNPLTALHVGTTGGNLYSSTITKSSNMKGGIFTQASNGDDMVGVYFATGSSTEGTHWSGITGSRSNNAAHWGTQLNFYTHDNDVANLNDATQKMIITGDGKVGIGTTSPASNLHVNATDAEFRLQHTGNSYFQRIFTDSSNNLKFGTGANGTERMRLDASGNLLIGTTSAGAKLYAKTGATGIITKFEGPAGRYVYSGTDSGGHYMEVAGTQASERILRIQGNNGSGTYTQLFINAGAQTIYTSSGTNVGIGTTNPGYNLTVNGTTESLALTLSDTVRMTMGADGTWNYIKGKSGQGFRFSTTGAGADVLVIQNAGNVGIGTDGPSTTLHVKSGANSNDGAIRIESSPNNVMTLGTDGTGHFINCVNTDPFRIKFAGSEKFRINSDGKVGIGTTVPTETLTVIGAICSKIGDGDLGSLTTNSHATNVTGGTLEFTTSYSGTLAAGRVFTFTYEATSWKSWMFEIEVASTHGFTTIKAGGYNNSSNSKNIYEVGDAQNGGTLTHTNNGQHNVFTYTLNVSMIHPTFKIKYTQGGGDGAPTMERMKLVIT